MQRHTSVGTLRGMFLLLCASSFIAHARGSTNMANEVLHTEDNHCQPILVNGELMPTEPEYMPSFPVSLKGIKRNFVCKLSALKTVSTTPPTTSSPTNVASTTSREATTNSITDSTTSNPTTTTKSTTTQDTTTIPITTEATASHSMTTTPSTTSLEATTNSISDSTTSNPTTTTTSTTSLKATTNSITDSTTSNPTTTTKSTTTQVTTIMSTTGSSTLRTTTATQSTAKIFVTDEGTKNKIFVADLQDNLDFTDIPSTEEPRYITYDPLEKKIYWTDEKRVYRADVDGENREEVTSASSDTLRGIAIDKTSRTLYIAIMGQKKIIWVSIAQGTSSPRAETDFISGLSEELYSLEVDEEKGFLYWSMKYSIQRKPLNGSGSTETVYHSNDLSEITGLSIDLSRNPRRIFFCDLFMERSFYKDVNQPLTDLNAAHELTALMDDPEINGEREKLRDISFFNGILYWAKGDNPSGIAVMTNYDQSSPSFDIKEPSEIYQPYQLLITNVDP